MALLCSHYRLMPEDFHALDEETVYEMFGMLKYYMELAFMVKFKSD